MNFCAICISKDVVDFSVKEMPFVNYTENWRPVPRDRSRGRIGYLAERRNAAVKLALEQYPETSHYLMIDSYYVNQPESIRALVSHYQDPQVILGGATWFLRMRRIWPENAFFDTWTTPEFRELFWEERLRKLSPIPVKAVGAVYVCPVDVWKRRGYGIPEYGCEHNFLCEGTHCFTDFGAEFWREPFVYPMYKRWLSSAGYFLRGYFLRTKHL